MFVSFVEGGEFSQSEIEELRGTGVSKGGMNVSEVLITSSVLICIIILLRALLKNRVSAVFIYSLWLLAALRLLFPLELAPSAISVMM